MTPRATRWKVTGFVLLLFTVPIVALAVLYFGGYGPSATEDRKTRLSPEAANSRIDAALRATTEAVSPSLTYAGADFEVEREPDHRDGEPSMGSDVTEIVHVRTVVSRAKLPALMDQVAQAWQALGSKVVDRPDPSAKEQYLRGAGTVGGETSLTFYASETWDSSAYTVMFRVEAHAVLYRPAQEYTPLSPLGRTPRSGNKWLVDPLDDPYWSH